MLQKISIEEAEKFSRLINQDSYPINPYWLAYNAYHEKRNNELTICERDVLWNNDFPFLVMPKDKTNWIRAIMTNATQEDLEKIKEENIKIRDFFKFGNEYYYKTEEFVNPEKNKSKNFKKAIKHFESKYNFNIKDSYPKEKILEFLENWKKTQKERNILFDISHEFEIFCIKKCGKINGKWLFVEINDKLAGYCLSYQLNKDFWVGIHQKVDYNYRGLSRFLLYKRASLFPKTKYFSLGEQARDKGIQEFKESLHPFKKVDRYYIVTDEKI